MLLKNCLIYSLCVYNLFMVSRKKVLTAEEKGNVIWRVKAGERKSDIFKVHLQFQLFDKTELSFKNCYFFSTKAFKIPTVKSGMKHC